MSSGGTVGGRPDQPQQKSEGFNLGMPMVPPSNNTPSSSNLPSGMTGPQFGGGMTPEQRNPYFYATAHPGPKQGVFNNPAPSGPILGSGQELAPLMTLEEFKQQRMNNIEMEYNNYKTQRERLGAANNAPGQGVGQPVAPGYGQVIGQRMGQQNGASGLGGLAGLLSGIGGLK